VTTEVIKENVIPTGDILVLYVRSGIIIIIMFIIRSRQSKKIKHTKYTITQCS